MLIASVDGVFMSVIQIWRKILKIYNKFQQLHSSCRPVTVKSLRQLPSSGQQRFDVVLSRCNHFLQKIWPVWMWVPCCLNRLNLSHNVNVTYGLNQVPPRRLCLPKLFAHPHWQVSMATVFAHISTKNKSVHTPSSQRETLKVESLVSDWQI